MKRRELVLCFALAFFAHGAEIPAGTNLEIRLTTPVSTLISHVKDHVTALLIAPVIVLGDTRIPAGAEVSGTVTKVTAAVDTEDASLGLSWNQINSGGHAYPVSTRLYSIDNVRETVDEQGAIQGISAKNTLTGRLDQGLGKLGNNPLAQVLEIAKGVLIHNADPNIAFDAGTELTLRLAKPLKVPDTPFPPRAAVPDEGHLFELVNNQTWQTYAARPPRPSDVTNLLLIGSLETITAAFREAGWTGAQHLTAESKWETARAVIEQRGYKEAPVSEILLGEQPPDLVFQKANNTFAARHHLRMWRSPDTYQGQPVWLCAATHDIGIDYSDRERTFIHKIDSNIDRERAKVVDDLWLTGKVHGGSMVDRPAVPTNFQNGTGDDVNTDARMAVLVF